MYQYGKLFNASPCYVENTVAVFSHIKVFDQVTDQNIHVQNTSCK